MSSQRFAQVVDCGGTHVSVGFFSAKDGNVTLDGFFTESIGCDFSNEEEWITAVVQATEVVHLQKKLRGRISLVVPGHLLLMKFLKIPHVAKSKRDQIVRFEAQQNIPFPLNEVVWDYEVVADDGTEFEVALVAVKLDIIDRLCSEFTHLGVEVQLVEPSCMAQYNAFHYSHPETDENILVANIGGKSSNLLFISEGGFFVRNISLAGNSLTHAIAEETGQSLADAEAAKWEFIAAAYEEGGEERFQGHVDSFLKRLAMETTRSVVNFRRQSGEEKIDRIFLTGGGALIPGISEYLSEKLKLPVEYYSPIEGISLGSDVDPELAEGYQHNIGELLGCALRDIGESKTHFNLLPPLIARQMRFREKKPMLMTTAVVLVASAFLPIFGMNYIAFVYEDNIEELDARLMPLQNLHSQYEEITNEVEGVRNRIAALQGLGESRGNWIDFFQDIQQRLTEVEDVWLERMEIVRSNGAPQERRAGGGLFRQEGPEPDVEELDENERAPVRLRFVGRMLDRENPLETASQDTRVRVRALFNSMLRSEFISRIENEEFDVGTPGILRFDVMMAVDPERPL